MSFLWRNARGVALALALLIVAGVYAYVRLPRGLYPELSFPRIAVVATLADATSEIVLTNVTRPLEEALMPVLGVRRVRSKTIRDAVEIDVLFEPESDMVVALQLVQARLADVRGELPQGTQVVAERITPTSFPIYTLNVEGSVPPSQLRDVALYQVRPALSRVPGVGPISVAAGFEREVEVEIQPARAEAAGLTVEEIARRLGEDNRFGTVGRLDRAYRRYAMVVRGNAATLAQMKEFVVGGTSVRLGDVATLREGWADPRIGVRSPRGPAAVVSVARRIGGDVTSLDTALSAKVKELQRELPPGVALTPVYQQAPLIEDATSAVRDAILLGALLSAAVIFLFLRSLGATLVAALTIPASLAISCAALLWFGNSLNLMSLGGMAIAVGLVIDDAVVVVEAIHRERAAGRSAAEAAQIGVQHLGAPVVSSTLTTVVVFAPLAFLSGVVGTFFAALSLALAAAVLASLVLSLTLVPLLAGRIGQAVHRDKKLAPRYHLWLSRALGRPWRVVAAALFVLGAGAVGSRFVESGFLPEIDEGAYVFDYYTPIGTSLAEADHLAQEIDRILLADPDVQTFSRRLGSELGPPRATETSRGDIIVRLRPHHRPIEEIMEEQRKLAASRLPGVRIELIQLLSDMLGDLEGNPEPIEVKLFGPDEPELRRQAARISAQIKDIDGLTDLYDGQAPCSPERVVRLDPLKLGRQGLSTAQVMAQLSAAQLGVETTPMPEQDRLVPVRVRWPDATRFDDKVLERVRLRTPAGSWVPLADIGRVEDACAPSEISRENLRLMVHVTARLEGRDLGSAVNEVESRLQSLPLPPGYAIEIGGQRLSQKESFRSLGLAIGGALALVMLVLVFQFRSFRAAFAILAALPLALAGGLLALVVVRVPLNVSSLLGGILLVGLVVKNGILLLHHAREREEAGVLPALLEAARLRLRPILMTTACTLLGLLPLALGLGRGSEMHRPLAVAVLGGLFVSTLGTLFVVPALYLLFQGRR